MNRRSDDIAPSSVSAESAGDRAGGLATIDAATLARLQQLAAVGELAAGVTHETRNLLTAIVGFAQVARMRGDPDSLKRNLDAIEREAAKCIETLERFLGVSQNGAPEPQAIEIAQVIAQIADATRHQLTMSRISLRVQDASGLPFVRCRRDELIQVLLNLVINAMHAMPNGGTLTLSATRMSDAVELSVADTGIGIAPELYGQIFEPFFTTGRGTGLGLALCRRMVAAVGGTIRFESAVGVGSTFRVQLPIAKEPG